MGSQSQIAGVLEIKLHYSYSFLGYSHKTVRGIDSSRDLSKFSPITLANRKTYTNLFCFLNLISPNLPLTQKLKRSETI